MAGCQSTLQNSAKRRAPGLVYFVAAVAYHFVPQLAINILATWDPLFSPALYWSSPLQKIILRGSRSVLALCIGGWESDYVENSQWQAATEWEATATAPNYISVATIAVVDSASLHYFVNHQSSRHGHHCYHAPESDYPGKKERREEKVFGWCMVSFINYKVKSMKSSCRLPLLKDFGIITWLRKINATLCISRTNTVWYGRAFWREAGLTSASECVS